MLHKLNYLTVDWPLQQASLFPRAQPLIIEIGFGNGDYLIHLAETWPNHNVVGFEISSQSMDKAEQKIEKRGLQNVRPIHCRAETALAHLLEPASVSAFHINYPDPWFKKRHGRRRLIKRETVELMASRLITGGELLLATDIAEYAEMTDEILAMTPGLENTLQHPWARKIDGRFRTKYELQGYREGRRGHFFVYRRNTRPVAHPAVIKDLDMPHMFLQSPLAAEQIVERFAPTRHAANGVHIAILHAFADPKRNVTLFEVVVEEPTIEQHTMITLSPRAEADQYIVKLSSIGHARPTYGMHRAVAAVGEYVAGLHEDGRVLARKLRE